jgi:hypothetical protein
LTKPANVTPAAAVAATAMAGMLPIPAVTFTP